MIGLQVVHGAGGEGSCREWPGALLLCLPGHQQVLADPVAGGRERRSHAHRAMSSTEREFPELGLGPLARGITPKPGEAPGRVA